MQSDSLVIIPTYNECENIEQLITTVMNLQPNFDVLIIDDGSPDGTAQLVKQFQKEYAERLFLIERAGKLGLGTAYIAGFKYAIEKGYNYIMEMDADFSHNPTDLARLREACMPERVGMSVGSRYIPGGKLVNWPLNRIIMSRGASFYVRLITWMPVNDSTAGFVCYKRQALERLDLNKIKFVGYAFQIEMKFAIWTSGWKIKEVPITFKDREVGVSKMSISIFHEAFLGVLKMKLNSFTSSYKKEGHA
jgi:dolichol-phosphate mannosyltransferase